MLDLMQELQLLNFDEPDEAHYKRLPFTLTTPASHVTFKRYLWIANSVISGGGTVYEFTALFYGQIVSGFYNAGTRHGLFNLD